MVVHCYPIDQAFKENEKKEEETEIEKQERDKEEEEEKNHPQKEKTLVFSSSSKESSSSSSSPPLPLFHSFHPPSSSSSSSFFSKPMTGMSSRVFVEGKRSEKEEKKSQQEEKKEEGEVRMEEKIKKPQASPRRGKIKLSCFGSSLRKKNPTLLSGQGQQEEEEVEVEVEEKNDRSSKKKNSSEVHSSLHTSSSSGSLSTSRISSSIPSSSSTILLKPSARETREACIASSSPFSTPSEGRQKEMECLRSGGSPVVDEKEEIGEEMKHHIEGDGAKKSKKSTVSPLSFSSRARPSPFFFVGGMRATQGKEEEQDREERREEEKRMMMKNSGGGGKVLPLFSYLNVHHEACRCSSSSSSTSSSSTGEKIGVRTTNGMACGGDQQRDDVEKAGGLLNEKEIRNPQGTGHQDDRQEKKRDEDEKPKSRLFSTQTTESLKKVFQRVESGGKILGDVETDPLRKEPSSLVKNTEDRREEVEKEKPSHPLFCMTCDAKTEKSQGNSTNLSMGEPSKEACQWELWKDHRLQTDEELRSMGDVYSVPNLESVKQQERDGGREEERNLTHPRRPLSLKKSRAKNEKNDTNQKRRNMREEAKDKFGVLEKAVKNFLEKSKKSDEVLQTPRQKEEEEQQQQGVSARKKEDSRGIEKEPQKRKASSFFFSSSSSPLSSSSSFSGKKDSPRVSTPQGEATVKEEEREVLSMTPLEIFSSNKKNLSEKLKATTRVRNLFEKMRNRDTPPTSRVGERTATVKQEEEEEGEKGECERDRRREKQEQQEIGEDGECSTGLAGSSPDSVGSTSKKEMERVESRNHHYSFYHQRNRGDTPSKDGSKNNSPPGGIRDLFSFIGSFFGNNGPSENDDREMPGSEKGRNRTKDQAYIQTERELSQNRQETHHQTGGKEEEEKGKKEESALQSQYFNRPAPLFRDTQQVVMKAPPQPRMVERAPVIKTMSPSLQPHLPRFSQEESHVDAIIHGNASSSLSGSTGTRITTAATPAKRPGEGQEGKDELYEKRVFVFGRTKEEGEGDEKRKENVVKDMETTKGRHESGFLGVVADRRETKAHKPMMKDGQRGIELQKKKEENEKRIEGGEVGRVCEAPSQDESCGVKELEKKRGVHEKSRDDVGKRIPCTVIPEARRAGGRRIRKK